MLRRTNHEEDQMAELTNLESKLGEVTGLAMAAQVAQRTVIKLAREDYPKLVAELERMREQSAQTEKRCTELAATFAGKKTAIMAEARDVKGKGAEMLKIYLDADADALDGFEFLTMAEAAEVGHWSVLEQMSRGAGKPEVAQLVAWALPIQDQHYRAALEASKEIAAAEDPSETA
jgi:hypothetical protein